MNILFVVNALGSGGAEKIFMDIVNNFDYSRHSVTVAMVDHFGILCSTVTKRSKEKNIYLNMFQHRYGNVDFMEV